MPYYLIIAFQAFCIYHLIKKRNEYYWIFLIIFLPLIGCIIYLVTQVYNKRDAEKVTNEIVSLINPTKKVKDLEKKLQFAETFQNRVDLADAYYEIGDYQNAINHFEKAIDGDHQKDSYVIKNLIASYNKIQDYNQVVIYSKKIKNHSEFKKSNTQFLYGLALEKLGKDKEAEQQLEAINVRYSNYDERLVLAKFLISKNRKDEAKELLNQIYAESQNMTKVNKRKYKATILEVQKTLKNI